MGPSDACGSGLFCGQFEGDSQPKCYYERSRQDRESCTDHVQCYSYDCNLEVGACRSGPDAVCTERIGCAAARDGHVYKCVDDADGNAAHCKVTNCDPPSSDPCGVSCAAITLPDAECGGQGWRGETALLRDLIPQEQYGGGTWTSQGVTMSLKVPQCVFTLTIDQCNVTTTIDLKTATCDYNFVANTKCVTCAIPCEFSWQ